MLKSDNIEIMYSGSTSLCSNIEKFYQHFHILSHLGKLLVIITFVFLLSIFLRFIIRNRLSKILNNLEKIFKLAIWVGFSVFTVRVIFRWASAGQVPWSMKYETMVFGAWACLLAGIVLSRHSRLPIIFGSLLSGIVLIVANLQFTESAVSYLPPVLKSRWFVFHVSTAMLSYGFCVIGTVMALLSLSVLGVSNSGKENNWMRRVSLWSRITEQSLWIGLLLLTVGSTLGAVWANESWGKYWGWDPKESWALIVILSYGLVLHIRLVSHSYWRYWLNVMAFPAFGTLLMTFFGVNIFFSGMHSYGGGEGSRFPLVLFWLIGGWIFLSLLAYRNREQLD